MLIADGISNMICPNILENVGSNHFWQTDTPLIADHRIRPKILGVEYKIFLCRDVPLLYCILEEPEP